MAIAQHLESTSQMQSNKMTFLKFIQAYSATRAGVEDLTFIGYFTVIDIVALRLLCRETARIFNEEVQQNVIRIGNLDPSIRIYFWVLQAPFYEIESELKRMLNVGSVFESVFEHLKLI